MAKITVIASPHAKDYDELRASYMAKEKYEAYFLELDPEIVEKLGIHPSFEASYNFAKQNNIPIHFVDDAELLLKQSFVDIVANRFSYPILRYHLKNAGYDIVSSPETSLISSKILLKIQENGEVKEIFRDIKSIPLILNKSELNDTIDSLLTSYQASYGCVRERSSAIAKNTDAEIRKNGYSNSVLECGSAHTDIADILKEKHDVKLIVLGENNYRGASQRAEREINDLQEINDIKLPQNVRDDIFNRRRLDLESETKFAGQKISFETLRKNLPEIYLKYNC
jgi:hypothetical protein